MKMKSCVALAMGVLFSMNSWAQRNDATATSRYSKQTATSSQEASLISIEPMIGYNMSTFAGIEGANGASLKSKGGLQGGAAVTLGRSSLQFETGLFYASRGATLENIYGNLNIGQTASLDFTLRYLDVPLLARYTTSLASDFKFYAHGGAVLGFLQDSKVESKRSYTGQYSFLPQSTTSESADDYFHKFDTRLLAGVGGVWSISRSLSLTGALDYQLGVTKINTDQLANGYDVYNSSLGLNLGLKLDI